MTGLSEPIFPHPNPLPEGEETLFQQHCPVAHQGNRLSSSITKEPRKNKVLTLALSPIVTPAKAGVQKASRTLDSGFRRNDDQHVA